MNRCAFIFAIFLFAVPVQSHAAPLEQSIAELFLNKFILAVMQNMNREVADAAVTELLTLWPKRAAIDYAIWVLGKEWQKAIEDKAESYTLFVGYVLLKLLNPAQREVQRHIQSQRWS